ncbi:NDR1/HIN1-like protein 1 [Carex rostrata]
MSKDKDHKRRHFFRGIVSLCVTIVFFILLIILIVYLVLRPTKPKFYLQNLHLIKLNSSPATNTPPTLTINLQATLASRNPNSRIGIYYSSLNTYVTYRDEPVTVPVSLPPVYEGHKDVSVWSPVLYGSGVPVDPYIANAIAQDQAAGVLLLHVKVDGRVKWKVGTWTSGHYHLWVNCPIFVSPSNGNPLTGFGLPDTVECHVDV